LRILHIMQCANLGGMERTTLLRMEGLKAQGNEVRLVSLNPIGGLGPLLERASIPAVGLPYRGAWGWRSLPAMYRAFTAQPADAVMMHGHNLAAMVALAASRVAPGRRVLCIHYHHSGVKPAWQWRLIYSVAVRTFRAVTFPTDFVRAEAERLYPRLRTVSYRLPNPFPLPSLPSDQQRHEARRRLGLPPQAKVIGNAGWLIHRKRFDVFLRVGRAVASAVPEVIFVVAGDGPLRPELMQLAQNLGIAERLRWLGWQQDMADFYRALDVLHFNSDWDALGRTPLEAAAHGVPVVASVVHGGLGEFIDSPEYGYLISAHDEDWLAEKIIFLLRNPEAGRRTALACRKRLEETCSPEKDLDRVCRLLGI
jgi:glycosyltransferase involved in cell wall biosynthesis